MEGRGGLAAVEGTNPMRRTAFMIAAAATLAGCARLWSQDMQDGMKIGDKLRVANPFK